MGTCHNYACSLDQPEPASSLILSSSRLVTAQPKITTLIQQSSEEPTLLSQQFKTLVKVQRENGFSLTEGERYLYLS